MTITPDDTEVAFDEGVGLWLRPATTDRAIAFNAPQEYRPLGVEADDVVLDLGGHIGSACRYFLRCGAKQVVTVEPEPYNFALLERNVAGLPVTAIDAAVTATAGEVKLYTNPRQRSRAAHSTADHYPGRDTRLVRGVAFVDLLRDHEPDRIKVDCEGAEYEIFESITTIPESVVAVVMEMHLARKSWRTKEAPALADRFLQEGFVALLEPDFSGGNGPKHTLACWHRRAGS
jgi:FkbM family methyltransferase